MEVDFTGRVTPIPNTQGEEVSGGSQKDSESPVPPLDSSAKEVSGELVTMEGLEAIREAEKRKREVKARLQDEVAQDKVKSGVGATLAKIAEAAIYVKHHEKRPVICHRRPTSPGQRWPWMMPSPVTRT